MDREREREIYLSVVAANAAIDAFIEVSAKVEVVLEDIEDADHLREDEHLQSVIF
jgi:hypothetical protein